jgi:hypothetical protein
MHRTTSRPRLHWATGDDPIVTHVGARLLCDLADTLGLTHGLTDALVSLKQRRRGHDRGRVLTHLTVAIADGATRLTDLAVLARQPDLFGPVASVTTSGSSRRWTRWPRPGRSRAARPGPRGATRGFMSWTSTARW